MLERVQDFMTQHTARGRFNDIVARVNALEPGPYGASTHVVQYGGQTAIRMSDLTTTAPFEISVVTAPDAQSIDYILRTGILSHKPYTTTAAWTRVGRLNQSDYEYISQHLPARGEQPSYPEDLPSSAGLELAAENHAQHDHSADQANQAA